MEFQCAWGFCFQSHVCDDLSLVAISLLILLARDLTYMVDLWAWIFSEHIFNGISFLKWVKLSFITQGKVATSVLFHCLYLDLLFMLWSIDLAHSEIVLWFRSNCSEIILWLYCFILFISTILKCLMFRSISSDLIDVNTHEYCSDGLDLLFWYLSFRSTVSLMISVLNFI